MCVFGVLAVKRTRVVSGTTDVSGFRLSENVLQRRVVTMGSVGLSALYSIYIYIYYLHLCVPVWIDEVEQNRMGT